MIDENGNLKIVNMEFLFNVKNDKESEDDIFWEYDLYFSPLK